MSSCARVLLERLGFVWAMPNTLLGLIVGALTFQAPRIHDGAIVFDAHHAA